MRTRMVMSGTNDLVNLHQPPQQARGRLPASGKHHRRRVLAVDQQQVRRRIPGDAGTDRAKLLKHVVEEFGDGDARSRG